MIAFQHLPIKRKVTAVIMLTSIIALVLTAAAFILYDALTYRHALVQDLSTSAAIIADRSTAALDFGAEDEAQEMLQALKADPHILYAAFYDAQGNLFVRYPPGEPVGSFPLALEPDGHNFERGFLVLFQPVVEGNKRVGTLYLQSDLSALSQRLRTYTGIALLVLLGSALVAFAVSNALQRSITRPIFALADAAKGVSARGDYSVRAQKISDDELGLLTDAFNQMLARIQAQTVAVLESEARKTAILESAIDCLITMDHEGRIVDFNAAAERTFGFGRSDIIGRTAAETIIPARLRAAHCQGLARFRESGVGPILGRRIEMPALRADGTEFPSELTVTATSLESGLFFTAYLRDITERKRAEEALSFMAAIVASSDDAIIGKDLQSRVVSWNTGAERMFGYTAAEMLGQPISRLIAPDRPEEEERILKIAKQGETRHYETVRLRQDGRPIEISLVVSPIKDAQGAIIGLSSIARDITERIQAEQNIRQMNLDLERRVRERTAELTAANKELEAFTYSVAHDLRAPLRHIDAFTKILREDFSSTLPSEASRLLHNIQSGSRNMSRLVDDLLNLARVGRQELARLPTPLDRLVKDVRSDLEGEARGRVIEWRVQPLPIVQCDPGLMKQVFANLLANAVKYTRPRPVACIEVGRQLVNNHTAIFVRDNGVGFNMKYQDKLFGVFSRLHRAEEFEGTGVGLATVQRIIRKHGGAIWAESALDKGAVFYFTIPGLDG